MFDLSKVEERDIIPIPMGQPSDDGIGVSDWVLDEVKVYDPTDKAGSSIGFIFKYVGDRKNAQGISHKGAKFEHREFDPTFNTNPNITDEQKQKSFDGVQSRIKHILGRFISEENVAKVGKAENFKALIDKIAAGLPKAAANVNCTLKLVYYKSYVRFPLYRAFISTDSYPKSFKYNPDYDKLVAQGATPSPQQELGLNDSDDDPFGSEEEVKVESQQEIKAEVEEEDPFA